MPHATPPTWHAVGAAPDAVVAAFAAAGWRAVRSTRDALLVRWVGTAWERGVAELSATSERQRARTVLAGEAPPDDIGEQIRAAGGLSWLSAPWTGLDVLAATLDRTRTERPLHRVHEVAGLEEWAGTTPTELLRALADRAGRLLGCAAEVWYRGRPGLPFTRAAGDGPTVTPAGLAESALRASSPVVLPRLDEGAAPSGHRAAAAVPLHRETALDEPAAVLILAWPQPFLPTVAEVRLLELLGTLGRLSLQRLFERDRLVAAHGEHARALTGLLGRSGGASPDELVERVLATRAGHPDLLSLHARLSSASRGKPAWHHWSRGEVAPGEDEAVERFLDWVFPGTPGEREDGRWVMVEHVGTDGSQGCIVGVFTQRATAIAGASVLADLASALALGARVLRGSADSAALDVLSAEQNQGARAGLALDGILGRIRDRLSADGAGVHVVQRTAGGPALTSLRGPRSEVPDEALLATLVSGAWVQSPSSGNTWHLTAPLAGPRGPWGVLEVWREGSEPFDEILDPDALMRFAPYVSATTRRVLQDELLGQRLAAMSGLLDELVPERSIHDAAAAVTAHTGRLAGAAAALLVRRTPGDDGVLYVESAWAADAGHAGALLEAASDLRAPLGAVPWIAHLQPPLRAWLDAWGLDGLVHRTTLPSSHAPGSHPTSAVVLLDRPGDGAQLGAFAPDAQEEAAAELVRYAAALNENATRGTARAAAEGLARVPSEPDALLAAAASAIRATAGVDAVLIAAGDQAGMRVVYADPERTSLIGLPVEVDRLDEPTTRLVQRAYGWRSLRSALPVAIDDRGRRLGVLWALSGERGPMIGWHREQVIRQVAARLALELYRARRRRRLEDLNAVSTRLAGRTGRTLAHDAHSELTAWVERYLRPDAVVVIVARAHGQQPLVSAVPAGWDEAAVRTMHQHSRRWGTQPMTLRPGDLTDVAPAQHTFGLASPLLLREAEQLTGHLVVLHAVPFAPEQHTILEDAARELAVLLDAERVRHGFMAETGLFRHALLSPIQGLTDAALFLADLAAEDPVDHELVADQRVRILREAEKVRHWRTIQRLYGGGLLGGEVRLQPRRQPLRPVVEACMDRFRLTLARRGNALSLEWDVRQAAPLSFDADAVDILLSNLLDNASKYAFANRPVTVGAWQDRRGLHLGVQDFGHPVPDGVDIYAAGERLRWSDPFRSIHGEGLGLLIVRSLMTAHGGSVAHECRPETAGGREETRPYVVRFVVTFPRDEV